MVWRLLIHRNSEIDIVQAVGRAIRLSKGKAIGSIVIPVFIEDHEDPDEVLNSSPFKKVWAVVNALRSHDEGLGEELDQLRQAMGKRGTVGKSDKIVFDLPTTITHNLKQHLSTKVIESTTASWEFWFGLLEIYTEENGDCLVPTAYVTSEGFNLRNWVKNQRNRRCSLTENRRNRLDGLGFIWNEIEHVREIGLKELTLYKGRWGHCKVPQRYESKTSYKLGMWVSNIRRQKHVLPQDFVRNLDDLGFIWDHLTNQWEEGFNELKHYKNLYGSANVPTRYETPEGYLLGRWVADQRNRKGEITQDRIRLLDGLEFSWSGVDDKWESKFKELLIFIETFGHAHVSKSYETPSGVKLGEWARNQRSTKRIIDSEKIKRLDEVGFIWNLKEARWNNNLNDLIAYKKDNGHCRVPITYKTAAGNTLGTWVRTQRQMRDDLSPDRISRLDTIGFIWDVK